MASYCGAVPFMYVCHLYTLEFLYVVGLRNIRDRIVWGLYLCYHWTEVFRPASSALQLLNWFCVPKSRCFWPIRECVLNVVYRKLITASFIIIAFWVWGLHCLMGDSSHGRVCLCIDKHRRPSPPLGNLNFISRVSAPQNAMVKQEGGSAELTRTCRWLWHGNKYFNDKVKS